MEEGREVAHGGGAADLSGASGRVAAEAGLLQSGRGSGSAAVDTVTPERQCGRGSDSAAEDVSGAIYIVLGYHRRFLIRTVCDN